MNSSFHANTKPDSHSSSPAWRWEKFTFFYSSRGLSGIVQGYSLVCFLIDLHDLGWSPFASGTLLSGSLLYEFVMTLLIGRLADRNGTARLLAGGEVLSFFAAILYFIHTSSFMLGPAAVLSGMGQRSNGSPGPFAPAEQVLLIKGALPLRTFAAFGKNTSFGLLGMSIGAILGSLSGRMGFTNPYQNLDLILAILAIFSLTNVLLILIGPKFPEQGLKNAHPPSPHSTPLSKREKKNLSLLILSNAFFGFGMGLVDPMIAYWFILRFHTDPSHTAFFLAVSFLASAGCSYFLSEYPEPGGSFRFILLLQFCAFFSLALIPFLSFYSLDLFLYSLRIVFTRAPGGLRQAMATTLVSREHVGKAASFYFTSLQIAQIAAPSLTGFLWRKGLTNAPMELAIASSMISIIIYAGLFLKNETENVIDVDRTPGGMDPDRIPPPVAQIRKSDQELV